jgi:hypothetical protein
MLSLDDVVALYRPEYFEEDYHCGASEGSYVEEIEAMRQEFTPYLSMIQEFCPSGRYLEIGCAGGATLAEARERDFETIGVDYRRKWLNGEERICSSIFAPARSSSSDFPAALLMWFILAMLSSISWSLEKCWQKFAAS